MRPLFAITPPDGAVDPALIDRWHDAGAHGHIAVWLREPGRRPEVLLGTRLRPLVEHARRCGVPMVLGVDAAAIESAAEVVAREGLAGVVLRGDPTRAQLVAARARLGPLAWLGRSSHRADAADHDACDFTALAPIFAPHTPKGITATALGTDALAHAAALPHAHIVALGGLDAARAAACLDAGAHGLAGIRSFFGAPAQVDQDVAAFCTALQTARHAATTPARREPGAPA